MCVYQAKVGYPRRRRRPWNGGARHSIRNEDGRRPPKGNHMPSHRQDRRNARHDRDARNAKYGGRFGGKPGSPSEFTRQRLNDAPRNPKLYGPPHHFTSTLGSSIVPDDIEAKVNLRAPMVNIKGDR
jgi:hypothetical protein